MGFLIYDLTLLVIFAILVLLFLYKKRSEIKREGLLLLYRTEWGIKLINLIGKKYKKTLKVFSYISITSGYILMILATYLFVKITLIYVFNKNFVSSVKVPPIMPLIPYLPRMFKLDFLPSFYFIYWILILAIVAIPHEFFHGIFAAGSNIKIKKTGFGFFPYFFPVFLAAFVEPDEKQMKKKGIFSQMSVLSAGTFANILTGILAFILLWSFFSLSYAPSGVIFNNYPYNFVKISDINSVNNITVQNHSYESILSLTRPNELNEFKSKNISYLANQDIIKKQNKKLGYLVLFYDAPAIKNNLTGAIHKINNEKITDKEKLKKVLEEYKPGDKVDIQLENKKGVYEKEITLGKNPQNQSIAFLGVSFLNQRSSGITKKIISAFSFRKPNIYYKAKFAKGPVDFIYNFLWWTILIAFSVGIINMIPVGIFDGGRFFYLTILAITNSKKIAEKSFKFVTFLFLFLLLVLIIFWGLSFL